MITRGLINTQIRSVDKKLQTIKTEEKFSKAKKEHKLFSYRPYTYIFASAKIMYRLKRLIEMLSILKIHCINQLLHKDHT